MNNTAMPPKNLKKHKGSFGNVVEQVYFPHTAIKSFLKSRSYVLKLRNHSYDELTQFSSYKIFGEDLN